MQPEGFPTSQSWSGNFWWSPEKHWLQESRQNRGTSNWIHVSSWHRREDSKPASQRLSINGKEFKLISLKNWHYWRSAWMCEILNSHRLYGSDAGCLAELSRDLQQTLACSMADRKWESLECWLVLWVIPVPVSRSHIYLRPARNGGNSRH